MSARARVLTAFGLLAILATTADAQEIIRRTVNLDYYLLNYFNRLAPLPRGVDAESDPYGLEYATLSTLAPQFYYLNHDLDFAGASRSARSDALGGAAVATASGAEALVINPAGLAWRPDGSAGDVRVGIGNFFGSSQSELTDFLIFDTGIVGRIDPLEVAVEPRYALVHDGLMMSGLPFYDPDADSGFGRFLGRTALAVGYREFVDIKNSTNAITRWLPEGGVQGLTGELKSAGQSREEGGIGALVFGLATTLGDRDGNAWLNLGGAANLASGRVRAEQVFTVSQLTQLVVEYPGPLLNDASITQKFTGTAFDLGAQIGLRGGAVTAGAVFRPEYTLEMRSGKYQLVQDGFSVGNPTVALVVDGRIADYDMTIPATLTVGGSVHLTNLLGDGVDRGGIMGYVHRFFGRGRVDVDYSSTTLSDATVDHVDEFLTNDELSEEFEFINQALQDELGDDTDISVDTNLKLHDGSANLYDKTSIHVGFETPLFDRAGFGLDLRLGWEEVPFAFPSLVLGDEEVNDQGVTERPVLLDADGFPQLEEATGNAVSFGLGFHSGRVGFDMSFRRATTDYVTWWGGTPPFSLYDPFSGDYEFAAGATDADYAAQDVSLVQSSLRFAATLHF